MIETSSGAVSKEIVAPEDHSGGGGENPTTALHRETPARLRARGLKPLAALAASRPHGDRLRYLAGCRCAACRRANSRYECARQRARREGDWNGIVSAARARRHILALSRRGLGRRAVAAASDVRERTIQEIRTGKKLRIRARSARKIMAVTKDAASDRALIPAGHTQTLIRRLLNEWYTKADLARRLGYKTPALQINRERVTVRNAWRVEKLYKELTQ